MRLLNTPSVAMGQVTKELLHMGELAVSMMDDVFKLLILDTWIVSSMLYKRKRPSTPWNAKR